MKPVLLAANNPISSDPRHALYPHPSGCTGHRLWRMLDDYHQRHHDGEPVTRRQYLEAFDRRDVVSGKQWSVRDAIPGLKDILVHMEGRDIVVLGAMVMDIFVRCRIAKRKEWGEWQTFVPYDLLNQHHGTDVARLVLLPHPSGRCREYSDPAMAEMAGRTLSDLYRRTLRT